METSGLGQLCGPGPFPPKHESTRSPDYTGERWMGLIYWSERLCVQAGKASDGECVLAACGCPSFPHPPLSWGVHPAGAAGAVSHTRVNHKGRQAGSEPLEWILVGPEQGLQLCTWPRWGQGSWGRKPFVAVLSQKPSWRNSLFSLDRDALAAAGSHLVTQRGGSLEGSRHGQKGK